MKILAYHNIENKSNFEAQIQYLKANYNIVSPKDLEYDLFINKKADKGNLLITFDDGDRSLFHNALPVLRRHKIPAIIFVITDLIGTSKAFWWDEIEYYLGKEEGNKKVWEVKSWPNIKREQYLNDLRKNAKKPPLKYKQLSRGELNIMRESNMLIASHSHTHPMFDQCTSEELDLELDKSSELLKKWNFNPYFFAYPNGNFSLATEEKLKKYGIKFAFLFDHKLNKENIDPLRISRLIVNDTTPIWKLKLILSGWHSSILPLTRFIGKISGKLRS